MTSIKPPSSPIDPQIAVGNDVAPKATPVEGSSSGFKTALDEAAGVDGNAPGDSSARTAGETAPSQAPTPVGASEAVDTPSRVVADLRAGAIDLPAAVDRLVAQTLSGPEAQLLNDAGRRALEEHLRSALRDDPALQAAIRDLGRA